LHECYSYLEIFIVYVIVGRESEIVRKVFENCPPTRGYYIRMRVGFFHRELYLRMILKPRPSLAMQSGRLIR